MLKSKFSLHNDAVEEEQGSRPEHEGGEGEGEGEGEEREHTPPVTAEEEREQFEFRMLQKSEISIRLSWLGKTAEGDGYTYLKATCTGMNLTIISAIKSFKHLQFVDFSENNLSLEALQEVTELPYLLFLKADKNQLYSANLKKCKYLQVIVLNNNMISSAYDVFQPELSTLELGYNKIHEIKFLNKMPEMKVLDFRYNVIRELTNLDFPNLDSLFLAGNKIKELDGIGRLQNLRILHVRNNPIKYLSGFEEELPKLKYVNLRNCKILTLRQIRKLKEQPALEVLVLKGCPYMGGEGREDAEAAVEEEGPELRIEVLATLPRLKRLNKGVYEDEERQEAKDLMRQWLEEGDKEEDEEVSEENPEEEDQAPEHGEQ